MVFAGGSSNLMQRLSRLPTAPHFGSLHRGKLYPYPLRHEHHLIKKRFISDSVASTGRAGTTSRNVAWVWRIVLSLFLGGYALSAQAGPDSGFEQFFGVWP